MTTKPVHRADGRPSVCLSMIVKNEARVIERCLASVLPFIDAWVVCDTGSSDDTMDRVRKTLRGLPGELVEHPWKDFSHNRNEALKLARAWADFSLVIDADEELVVDDGFELPELTADAYSSRHRGARSDSSFERIKLIHNARPWRYVGKLHEALTCDGDAKPVRMEGMLCLGHFDSARNQGGARAKYLADAALLERIVEDDPEDARSVFYLARSYADAGEQEAAVTAYRRRIDLGGWEEEVFMARYQAGLLLLSLGRLDEGRIALLDAHAFRPRRVEPLCALARHHRLRGEWPLAYLFARRAVDVPRPDDVLWVTDSMYAWRAADELSIAAYYVGRHEESRAWATRLLEGHDGWKLPAAERGRVEKNLRFALKRLGERGSGPDAG